MSAKQELLEMILHADDKQLRMLEKLVKLHKYSPGYMAAMEAATPPGEVSPPAEVIIALTDEWAEKEGF